jgi:ATP-binding protein involved in chromosome partitioning
MITNEEIIESLRDVEDPEIHKSLVELNMIRNINVDGTHVSLEVVLTISGCPLHHTIRTQVNEKLMSLEGIESVDITLGTMTDEERDALSIQIRGRKNAKGNSPLLDPNSDIVFLAVASGKGGVGKSTVTANLAKALGESGLKVGLIDVDIYGFSIPSIFNLKDSRPTVIREDLIIPIEIENIKIISMHYFVPDNRPVIWRGPMLGKMIRNFFYEMYWGDIDVILLDLPPGTGDVALDIHQLLPKSKELIVTTPQLDAADVAIRAGLMGKQTNHEIVGVVENMAYYQCPDCGDKEYLFGEGGGERASRALGTELLAKIPLTALTGTALFKAGTLQAQVFRDLAQDLIKKLGLTQKLPMQAIAK